MTTRTAGRFEGWESRPFTDGYDGLRQLADREFSGVVTAGSATCCFLNGTIVGILDGIIGDFEDTTGTVYTAPSPVLSLLIVMQERREEARAKYYSEETPLSEAAEKLSDGGFTGYVELSENVLSGDYYVVYHGGRSMSVAFVGQSEQLLTGEEAFEGADDEVGIYKVYPVDIEPVEIPEPDPSPGGVADGTDSESPSADPGSGTEASAADRPDTPAWQDEVEQASESDTGRAQADEHEGDDAAGRATRESGDADPNARGGDERRGSTGSEPAGRTDEGADRYGRTPGEAESGSVRRESRDDDRPARTRDDGPEGVDPDRELPARERSESESRDPLAADTETDEAAPVEEPAELERRTIPSLEPDRTETAGGETYRTRTSSPDRANGTADAAGNESRDVDRGPRADPDDTASTGENLVEKLREREDEVEDLERRVATLEDDREDLGATVATLEDDRESLRAELEQVRDERDQLRSRVDQLRSRITELESELEGKAADADIHLTPADAIDQTDLRVRYDSRGDATLKTAHAGEADRDDVRSNLTLGYHTLFDDGNAAVEDEPFNSFLEGTLQYRFVEWIVHELLYEIRDTGNQKSLGDLYDAIPRIHEAQLDHGIRVTDEESAVFDMAFYDVDGNLLAVANVNDNRNKVGETMVSELLTDATRVREVHSTMVGAFLVTASVFNADARRIPKEESGGGGLFGGSNGEAYVSVSRSGGFHLCLVEEDDEENFHLDVPEL